MINEKDPEFLVRTQDVEEIVGRLRQNIPSTKAIMLDRIIKRTLYRVPVNSDDAKEKYTGLELWMEMLNAMSNLVVR